MPSLEDITTNKNNIWFGLFILLLMQIGQYFFTNSRTQDRFDATRGGALEKNQSAIIKQLSNVATTVDSVSDAMTEVTRNFTDDRHSFELVIQNNTNALNRIADKMEVMSDEHKEIKNYKFKG